MKLHSLIQSILCALMAFVIVSYALLYNQSTILDEVMGLSILAGIIITNWIITKKLLVPLQQLFTALPGSGAEKSLSFTFMKQKVVELTSSIERAKNVVGRLRNGQLDNNGNYDQQDTLLVELELLRVQLASLHEQEQERKWVATGMARFADLLRVENQSDEKFYQTLTSSIVKYMNANQGGLFLVADNEEKTDKHLSLTACYAYERQKFHEKRIEIGNGMIGQAYLEKQTILLRNVPDKFISITSGLGAATARNILIVPMKVNGNVECILEIASFTEFKQYQIEFLEKLGESIASTVSSMQINSNTLRLLKETQAATEQLRAQEEELRQNMEELTATQEEMGRKEKELSRLLAQSEKDHVELNRKLAEIEMLKDKNQRDSAKMLEQQEIYKRDIIEMLNQIPAKIFLKDQQGVMIICNKTVADGYGLPVEKVIGTHDRDHFDPAQVVEWEAQEKLIMVNGRKTFIQEERFHDRTKYLETTKLPFHIRHLGQTGIMGFQLDVTDAMMASRQEKELREEISRLKDNGDRHLMSA